MKIEPMRRRELPTLADQHDDNVADLDLVRRALEGRSEALDALLRRHQRFVYGVAVRMLWDPRDAEDVTQEVLLKIVTGLSSFRGDSAFRTWAYRIAVNHVLNCRRSLAEAVVAADPGLFGKTGGSPDPNFADEAAADPEEFLLREETRIACLSGMLLCLDREQRLTFILGEILEIGDVLGGEILCVTRENFRQRLTRARQQLYEFMRGRCGLADPANPCRCARKTRALVRAGIVDPANLRFVPSRVAEIERSAGERAHALVQAMGAGYANLFRDQAKAVISLLTASNESLAGTPVGEALLQKLEPFDPQLLSPEEATQAIRDSSRCAVADRMCIGICPDAEYTQSVLLDDLADALVAAGKARSVTKDEAIATLEKYDRNPKILSKVSGKFGELCCTAPSACIFWNMEKRGLPCVRRTASEDVRRSR